MARACLLAPTLASADAVGNDVAGMFAALRAHGVDVHAFAERWTADLALPVEPLTRYEPYAADPSTVTIYHHSVHSPAAAARFLQSAGPKVLRYHNVTPPEFFAPYSDELTVATRLGRRQTETLVAAGTIDLFLADSGFNAGELQGLGVPGERCHTLPPFHALGELDRLGAALPVLERYLDGHFHALFVGRVVPNKGHRHLLRVFATYRRRYHRPVRLFLVGEIDGRVRAYQDELRRLAEELQVTDAVVWTGGVAPDGLKAYLLLAHCFLVMSEHEGFCVPVLEAMAHGVPVVAYGAPAVRETVGDAGIVLDGLDYDEYAAALEVLFSRDDCRAPLIRHARRRVAQHFAVDGLSRRLTELLGPLLQPSPARVGAPS